MRAYQQGEAAHEKSSAARSRCLFEGLGLWICVAFTNARHVRVVVAAETDRHPYLRLSANGRECEDGGCSNRAGYSDRTAKCGGVGPISVRLVFMAL